jgi:hypothetical protein
VRSWNDRRSGNAIRITYSKCSLRYPACNVHAPYGHLWLARMYNISPHYLINETILKKKVIEHEVCFDFL